MTGSDDEVGRRGNRLRLLRADTSAAGSSGPPVRIAWFTIYVDDAIGTIGNLADPYSGDSLLFKVSESIAARVCGPSPIIGQWAPRKRGRMGTRNGSRGHSSAVWSRVIAAKYAESDSVEAMNPLPSTIIFTRT